MAFHTDKDVLIWEKLHTILIPDYLTLDSNYIRKFGTRVTNNKQIDSMISTNYTTVMICVSRILEYYVDGIEIQIPSRQTMIDIHKDIETYLEEWKHHINYDINVNISQHKELLNSLEKLSKYIYEKAKAVEVINKFTLKAPFGLVNNYVKLEEEKKVHNKPNYEGINKLIKGKTDRTRF